MLVAGGLAAVLAASSVGPAFADDLSDYLVDADDAIYSGRRITGTIWDGIESIGIVDIQHHDGVTFIGSESDYSTVGEGRMYLGGADEAAISFARKPHADVEVRYTVVPGLPTDYLGRPARIIDVMEGSMLRMRMVVDDSTAAPVATEVYGADGGVFRYSSMVEFSVSADPEMRSLDGRDYQMMLPLEDVDLPAEAAGYRLVDVYGGPHGSRQAFYSDGLFSFSVFTSHGWTDWRAMSDDEAPYDVDGSSYLRVVAPSGVWVLWNSPDTGLALVGDLPPDHIEQVLAELPRPGNRVWFKRIWFRFFG
jgi:hypothetical protein